MFEPSSLFSSQAEHLQLQLVCKKFNNIFKDNEEFSQGLTLYPDFPTRVLANLVVWMRFHSSFVKTLAVYCGQPCLEVVLACFLGRPVNLRHALLKDYCTSAVELLSQLPSVTTCELVCPRANSTALSPLLLLPNLQKLVLIDGIFGIMHLPLHLTNLTLEHSNLYAGSCCTSLKNLQLVSSDLSGLEASGVAGFLELETLSCRASCIGAAMASEQFECSKAIFFHLPASLSSLASLQDLAVELEGPVRGVSLDLSVFSSLSSLRKLWVLSNLASLDVTAGLTALLSLEEVHLATTLDADMEADNAGWHLRLNIDWTAMTSLQHLYLQSAHLACDGRVLGLTKLERLERLHLQGYQSFDSVSAKMFAALMYQLARNCPQVKLILDSVRAQDITLDHL